jgi:hypothetical protein
MQRFAVDQRTRHAAVEVGHGARQQQPAFQQAQHHPGGGPAVHGVEDVSGQAAHLGSVTAAVQNPP